MVLGLWARQARDQMPPAQPECLWGCNWESLPVACVGASGRRVLAGCACGARDQPSGVPAPGPQKGVHGPAGGPRGLCGVG